VLRGAGIGDAVQVQEGQQGSGTVSTVGQWLRSATENGSKEGRDADRVVAEASRPGCSEGSILMDGVHES
jgi:hypothetical protein